MKLKLLLTSFIVMATLTLLCVVFFFEPISLGDTTKVNVHPLVGFLTYVFMCLALFAWGVRELSNAYKSACFVAVPQMVLIVDWVLRGTRGLETGIAGIFILAFTWLAVAFVYQWQSKAITEKKTGNSV